MIRCVPVRGYFEVNCYIWTDDQAGHGFLIDPGAQGHALLGLCRAQGWVIEGILLTHGHFDHFGGIPEIREEVDLPIYIHPAGEAYLTSPRLNLSYFCHCDMTLNGARYFRDGDRLSLRASPESSLRVLHTPGHTPDSVVLYDEKHGLAFVGDTIFRGSRGNDGYPGGDGGQLMQSIRERILTLPDDTILYSGHSAPTTVRSEKPLYL